MKGIYKPEINQKVAKIGKKGVLVLPSRVRKRYGLREGSLLIAEETSDGILLRPAVPTPVEIYTKERQAEFFLSNAIDQIEYEQAREEVKAMGIDPDSINHVKPSL